MDEITEGRKKWRIEELRNLYSPPNMIRKITSKEDEMGSTEGSKEMHVGFWW
jgi:hypothetical protein